MLPHGCWRAPRGYDEVGPRLDQSLFGGRETHNSATRDSGVNRDRILFLGHRIYLIVRSVYFIFELSGMPSFDIGSSWTPICLVSNASMFLCPEARFSSL
jgi:hypothetical protein